MKNKPIGIFDSGVGGLTVAKEIMKLLPNETIIYLGDTANLPYGDKSEEILKQYSIANTEFLLKYDIKVLVVACNTASSVALDYLKAKYTIPILGVIEPAAKGAVHETKNNKIGVIGTNRTIKSQIYPLTLSRMDSHVKTSSMACPLFVPLIEENFIDHEATRLIARDYLQTFLKGNIDTLILGCTHYPLIMNIISEILPQVKLIDSAFSTAQELKSVLDSNNLLKNGSVTVHHQYFATDITEKLNFLANRILETSAHFKEVDLSK